MGKSVTIGGNKLGDSNQRKVYLHGFESSTFNLDKIVRTTMTSGLLTPVYTQLGLNGDTFYFDINSVIRTNPTVGPLFGAFKFQIDFFFTPLRLYNGLLHTNAVNIGKKMNQVKFPKIKLKHLYKNPKNIYDFNTSQISPSSLIGQLGLRGLGGTAWNGTNVNIEKTINAIPVLAYYDIFKNYYSNKQERNAYVITGQKTLSAPTLTINTFNHGTSGTTRSQDTSSYTFTLQSPLTVNAGTNITLQFNGEVNNGDIDNWKITYRKTGASADTTESLLTFAVNNNVWAGENNSVNFRVTLNDATATYLIKAIKTPVIFQVQITEKWRMVTFPLEEIDNMRYKILSNIGLNNEVVVNTLYPSALPYGIFNTTIGNGETMSAMDLVGLCPRTYQADLFQNWLNSQDIDDIRQMSNVDVSNGTLSIEDLSLQYKIYQMLYRIAVSGGTYEDWQEAVYGVDAIKRCESPIYCGGYDSIIDFQEVISTADTETNAAGDQPLGTIATRGIGTKQRGGYFKIKCKEPGFIMGIASITPLISYTQGNRFYFDLDNMDDLHKPNLDQIGFQDLVTERMAWWSRVKIGNDYLSYSAGKIPAWSHYQTDVNENFGDFAKKGKMAHMVLNRDYEPKFNDSTINDLTTYINPAKHNDIFADTELQSMNFWVHIKFGVKARRKMSANVIPNL